MWFRSKVFIWASMWGTPSASEGIDRSREIGSEIRCVMRDTREREPTPPWFGTRDRE